MRKKSFHTESSAAEPLRRRDLRWERLDNTAHLFPVIAGERMSGVYRICATLTEPIIPELLQQALDIVLPQFDGFNLRLRRGFFWNYFEENGKSAPAVSEERTFPCRFIHGNRNNNYLFRVTYYKYRINLEVFHVLADGMGGFTFLKELTYQYLRLRYPQLRSITANTLTEGTTLNREDSFLRHYRKSAKKNYHTQRAYLIRGERLRSGEFGVMHGYMSVQELKEICRQYDATINEYLVAVYIWSVYTEYLHGCPSQLPIRVAVPVNLRPYFQSITTKNFFTIISGEFLPTENQYTFREVLDTLKESLRGQLNAEHLEKVFSYNVSNQKNWFLKLIPLPLKHFAMRQVYTRSAMANTATISNVGRIEVAEAYRPYIEQFHAFMAISKGQHIKGTICSYNDTLVFTFSYDLAEPALQRGFFRKLTEDGIRVEIESNGVH